MNKTNDSFLEKKKSSGESENPILSIFCVDEVVVNEALLTLVDQKFEEELVLTLKEYGEVLVGIHKRLTLEGYKFINGKLYKQNNIQNYE